MEKKIKSKRKRNIIFMDIGFEEMKIEGWERYSKDKNELKEEMKKKYMIDEGDSVRIKVFEKKRIRNN